MQKKNRHKNIISVLVIANVLMVTVLLNNYVLKGGTIPALDFSQLGNAVGVSVGVPPNQYNTVAQELDEWDKRLDRREQELNEREVLLRESGQTSSDTSSVYIMAIGFLLLLLIVINFVLDWKRFERKKTFDQNNRL